MHVGHADDPQVPPPGPPAATTERPPRRLLLAATATELPEVYALENGALRRLTHHNDTWLSEVQVDFL